MIPPQPTTRHRHNMIKFTIEKGIPMPAKRAESNSLLNALRDMEVGDSFLIPLKTRNALHSYQKKTGHTFSSRKISVDQARVWRIA